MSKKPHRVSGVVLLAILIVTFALTACAQPAEEAPVEEAPAAEEPVEEEAAEEPAEEEPAVEEEAAAEEPAEEEAAEEEPAAEEPAAEEEAAKVLLITGTGGLGDEGFNDAGYAGAERAVEDFGVELDLVEPLEMAEFEPQYRSAASSGDYLLIVGLGFAQADPANLIAAEFPEQNIAIIDAASEQDSVAGVQFREEENAFLAGVLAAYVTQQTELEGINEDKVLGIVLGIDAPHVRRYAISYEAGAKSVDPEMEVVVGVVGDFADQAKAKELSLAQIDQGADIIYQVAGGAGLGVFTAAEERGVYAIGEGLNQNVLHPDFIIASTYKRMGDVVYDSIEAALAGEFVGGNQYYGFSEGYLIVDLEGTEVAISDEAIAALAEYEAMLTNGEIVAPTDDDGLAEYLASIGQ